MYSLHCALILHLYISSNPFCHCPYFSIFFFNSFFCSHCFFFFLSNTLLERYYLYLFVSHDNYVGCSSKKTKRKTNIRLVVRVSSMFCLKNTFEFLNVKK